MLIDNSDLEFNGTAPSEILNGQYLHLCNFLLKFEEAMRQDSFLVTQSPLYKVQLELADIETKMNQLSKRLDPSRCFRRINSEITAKNTAVATQL